MSILGTRGGVEDRGEGEGDRGGEGVRDIGADVSRLGMREEETGGGD